MNNFLEELKAFLLETKSPEIKVVKLSRWKRNTSTKIDIMIDKKNGLANCSDCQEIHKATYMWIKNNKIDGNVNITVKSQSIDKELLCKDDFQESIGEKVKIELNNKIDDRKNYTGFIKDIKNDKVLIELDKTEHSFFLDDIRKAKVIPDFDAILRKKK